jgi:hypothetical protein
MTAPTFTPEQIKAWIRYERVRKQGIYNMFDPRAAIAACLSEEQFRFCIEWYAELQEQATRELQTTH